MTPTQIARRADALYCETPKRELGYMVAYREADIEDLKAERSKLRELLRQSIYAKDDADRASIVSAAIALGVEVVP